LIKDMDKLLAIPDEEFLKMSPLEKKQSGHPIHHRPLSSSRQFITA